MEFRDLKINGTIQTFMGTTKEHFIEMYCNPKLDTIVYLDDSEEYLIIAIFSENYFEDWCVPSAEIEYLYNPVTDEVEWIVVSAEYDSEDDPEEDVEEFFEEDTEEYCAKIEKYESFLVNLADYILYNKRADYSDFRLWQEFQKFVEAEDYDTRLDNKVCLVEWLEQKWGAWFESVLDESFKYMNVTYLVSESFNEFCE